MARKIRVQPQRKRPTVEQGVEGLRVPVHSRTGTLGATVAELQRERDARQLAEAALQAKEQEFRAFVENSPDQIVRFDREFRRTYVNSAVTKALGLPAEAFVGKPIGSIQRDLGLELNPSEMARIRQRIEAVFESGEPSELETTWSLPQGRRTFSARYFPEFDRDGKVIAVLAIARDITERLRAYEELRALSARLRAVREEESARIAREVHDEVGQILTALGMDVAWLERKLETCPPTLREELAGKLQSMKLTLATAMEAVQRIVTELRPGILDELGLEAAVEWYVNEFQQRTGISCRLLSSLGNAVLDPDRSTALFRILQEALTNVARHAEAATVEIRLAAEDGRIVLAVIDDGRGIPPEKIADSRSLGLLGMRERARALGGNVVVRRNPGGGTTVEAKLPP